MPIGQDILPDWLSRRAAERPDAPALIAGTGPGAVRWTWRDLDRRTAARAAELASHGVEPGNRVGALLINGPHYVETVHALMRLRAILVPLNVRLAPGELAWQVRHCGARLLLCDAGTVQTGAALQGLVPDVDVMDVDLDSGGGLQATAGLAGEAPRPEGWGLRSAGGWPEADPDDGAPGHLSPEWKARVPGMDGADSRLDLAAVQCIMYTSGTTGRPKGALLTYGNHWWNAIGSVLNLGLQPDDRWLACLPLFHVGGLAIVMRCAIYGIPIVLPETGPAAKSEADRRFDPAAVNAAINGEAVTIVSVVSIMVARLLEAQGERPYPDTLRCMLLGGGPAPRPLLEACARRGIRIMHTYGLTETASQCVTLSPADVFRKLGSAGRPLLPNEVRILVDDAHAGATHETRAGLTRAGETPAPPEIPGTVREIGEILVRGPSVCDGYLPDDGNLAAPVPATDGEGWLHTGDVGYLDQEGYLYVLDRRTDLIVSGGENVYPTEVEAVLLTHPGVAEAGVYGVADEVWGQRVAAAVVPRTGTAIVAAELRAFCRDRLAGFKVPSLIHVVAALPRNAAGKLLRRELVRDLLKPGDR
jgi:O-succinylbenzoic acid--CoA ligase